MRDVLYMRHRPRGDGVERISYEGIMKRMAEPYGCQDITLAAFDLDGLKLARAEWRNPDSGTWTTSAYHDRLPHDEFDALAQKHFHTGPMALESFCETASDEQIWAFITDVCALEWCGGHGKPKGFRISRHTNVSNGYPVFLFEAYGITPPPPVGLSQEGTTLSDPLGSIESDDNSASKREQ